MSGRRTSRALLSVALCLIATAAFSDDRRSAPPDAIGAHSKSPLPETSLYQLPLTLTTASGVPMKLAALRGAPVIITMFYSQCASVCPLLTARLQRIAQRLSPSEQRQIRILMVSFDSIRDTPEALTAFEAEHSIEEGNWIVARASANDVRLLAAALGIQYRELSDHTFNHSAIISLADRDGVVQAQTADLTDAKGTFVAAVRRQLPPRVQSAPR